jgi:hypothetical protein
MGMISSRVDFLKKYENIAIEAHGSVPSPSVRPFMQAIAPAINMLRLATVVIGLAAGVHGDMGKQFPVMDTGADAIHHVMVYDGDPNHDLTSGGHDGDGFAPSPDDLSHWRDALLKNNQGIPTILIDNDALTKLGIQEGHVTAHDVQRLIDASGYDAKLTDDNATLLANKINHYDGFSTHMALGVHAQTQHPEQFPGGQIAIATAVFHTNLSPQTMIAENYGLKTLCDPSLFKLSLTSDQIIMGETTHEMTHSNDQNIANETRLWVAHTEGAADLIHGQGLAIHAPDHDPTTQVDLNGHTGALSNDQAIKIGERLAMESKADLSGYLNVALTSGNIEALKEIADVRALNAVQNGFGEATYLGHTYNGQQSVFYNIAPAMDQLYDHLSHMNATDLKMVQGINSTLIQGGSLSPPQLEALTGMVHPGHHFADLSPDQARHLTSITLAEFHAVIVDPFVPQVSYQQDGTVAFPGIEYAQMIASHDFHGLMNSELVHRAMEAEARLVHHEPGQGPHHYLDQTLARVQKMMDAVQSVGPENAFRLLKEFGVADGNTAKQVQDVIDHYGHDNYLKLVKINGGLLNMEMAKPIMDQLIASHEAVGNNNQTAETHAAPAQPSHGEGNIADEDENSVQVDADSRYATLMAKFTSKLRNHEAAAKPQIAPPPAIVLDDGGRRLGR